MVLIARIRGNLSQGSAACYALLRSSGIPFVTSAPAATAGQLALVELPEPHRQHPQADQAALMPGPGAPRCPAGGVLG